MGPSAKCSVFNVNPLMHPYFGKVVLYHQQSRKGGECVGNMTTPCAATSSSWMRKPWTHPVTAASSSSISLCVRSPPPVRSSTLLLRPLEFSAPSPARSLLCSAAAGLVVCRAGSPGSAGSWAAPRTQRPPAHPETCTHTAGQGRFWIRSCLVHDANTGKTATSHPWAVNSCC